MYCVLRFDRFLHLLQKSYPITKYASMQCTSCLLKNRGQRSKPSICTVVKMQKAQPQRTSAAALRSIFKASASVNAILLSKQRRRFTIEASGGRTKPDSVQGISLSSSPPTPRRAQPPERPSALRWFGSMHYAETLPFRKGGYPSFPPIWCASAARQQVPKSRFQ